ncbi:MULTISPECIES: hypothetical protein [unclassified Mycolicibacterium]|nr:MULTISPECIES: hypothetical protein [unclassified Mycolicibacterium]
MTAAMSSLARPPIYGIGSWRVDGESTDFEIGWDDFERDTDWAEGMLSASGVAPGDLVLVTSHNWENPWFSPVVHALRRLKAVYLTAEPFAWDARRVLMFLQRLPVKAFVGLGAETLEGLKTTGADTADLLGGVDILWARHDALPHMSPLGLDALPLVPLGPALVMGTADMGEAFVNDAEWSISAKGAELLVSTVAARRARFDSLSTGLRGQVGPVTGRGRVVTFDIGAESGGANV